jgi:hypothetical protein
MPHWRELRALYSRTAVLDMIAVLADPGKYVGGESLSVASKSAARCFHVIEGCLYTTNKAGGFKRR